jgi:hypothetical protein
MSATNWYSRYSTTITAGYEVMDGGSPQERFIAHGLPECEAKLVAAAPELLAALELIAQFEGDKKSPEAAWCAKIARAAIAKAGGAA